MDRIFKEFRGYHLNVSQYWFTLWCNQCQQQIWRLTDLEASLPDIVEDMHLSAVQHTERKHALQPRM